VTFGSALAHEIRDLDHREAAPRRDVKEISLDRFEGERDVIRPSTGEWPYGHAG
jgi:hypothetical protein